MNLDRVFWCSLVVTPLFAFGTEPTSVDHTRAIELYEARQYTAARAAFTRVAAEHGSEAETDFYLGRLALWFDDAPVALLHLERASKLASNDARIQNAMGDACGIMAQNAKILAKLGWAKRCLAYYLRAVELEPRNPSWRWSLVGYYCMAPRLAGGGMDKAYLQATELRRLDPSGGRVAFATLLLSEKNGAASFAEFDAVLRDSPDDFLALYNIGRCAALSGQQLDRDIAMLYRCLLLRAPLGDGMPSYANVHYRLGNLLEKKGRAEEARLEYARATAENADFRPAKMALRN